MDEKTITEILVRAVRIKKELMVGEGEKPYILICGRRIYDLIINAYRAGSNNAITGTKNYAYHIYGIFVVCPDNRYCDIDTNYLALLSEESCCRIDIMSYLMGEIKC